MRYLSGALLLFVLFSIVNSQQNCVWDDQYDLSTVGQVNIAGADGWYYSLNLCGAAQHCPGHLLACQYQRNETHALVNSENDLTFFSSITVGEFLTAASGEMCSVTQAPRVTNIKFVCGLTTPTIKEEPICTYTFQLPVPYDSSLPCRIPSRRSPRSSPTGISFIVIGVAVLCALIVLVIFRCRQRLVYAHSYSAANPDDATTTTTTVYPQSPMGTNTVVMVPTSDASVATNPVATLGPTPMAGLAPSSSDQFVPVYMQTQPGVTMPYVMSVAQPYGNGAVMYYPQQVVIN